MPRILVVYYSRSGTTKRVATEIADALGAEIEAISDRTQRAGLIGYLRSGMEGTFQKTVALDPPLHDLASYDLVILGSPTWSASLSSPVRSFIREHRRKLRDVAFFATCGGRGGESVLAQMTLESHKTPAAVLVLREGEVSSGRAATAIRQFADRVRVDFPQSKTSPRRADNESAHTA